MTAWLKVEIIEGQTNWVLKQKLETSYKLTSLTFWTRLIISSTTKIKILQNEVVFFSSLFALAYNLGDHYKNDTLKW